MNAELIKFDAKIRSYEASWGPSRKKGTIELTLVTGLMSFEELQELEIAIREMMIKFNEGTIVVTRGHRFVSFKEKSKAEESI